VSYAVHTGTCTYLLDEDGVCRWTHSPSGRPVPGSERCLGAQFVACLDLSAPGGLVGELRIGASALFARSEDGRFVLLRTPPIQRVEFREVRLPAASQHPLERVSREAEENARRAERARQAPAPPPPASPPLQEEEVLDVENLVTYTEVTLTIPLYRPEGQSTHDSSQSMRRSMIGQGRRLR